MLLSFPIPFVLMKWGYAICSDCHLCVKRWQDQGHAGIISGKTHKRMVPTHANGCPRNSMRSKKSESEDGAYA
ncbi:MAG: hypothetical protein AXW12_16180 [Thalassospira sp. Nap_22]|nr:MAG: hypothetical protein AXW12_16180 [Thalassospira sp. Nap_22]